MILGELNPFILEELNALKKNTMVNRENEARQETSNAAKVLLLLLKNLNCVK